MNKLSEESDDVEVLVARGVKLPVASILDGAAPLLLSPSALGSGELLLEALGVQQGALAYALKPHKGRYFWTQIKAAEIPPRVDDQVHVFVVKPAQSDIGNSDVIKRKLDELGVQLSHVDSHDLELKAKSILMKLDELGVQYSHGKRYDLKLKRIKYASSQTDYLTIGKEFQGREDWVESHSIFETFEIDVTDQVKSLLEKFVIGFQHKEKESEKDAAKRYEEELSSYSFKDLRLAEAEAEQRNAEVEGRFKKYGDPKGEGVVQLVHGRVCRLLQAAGICYRAEDTHRRGVANAAVGPDLAYFDGLSAGCDISVMVIPVELKENLNLADALAGAIGELISRLRDILDAQHLRRFAYGYIADGEKIMIIMLSRMEHVLRTGWLKLDFSTTSPGLHMLLKLLYSHRELHGYMPLPSIPAFTTGDGRTVKRLRGLASKVDGSHSRGIVVYQANMAGQEVVVKIGPHLGEEVRAMLELPQDIGVVPLLAYGYQEKDLEGQDYLITPYFTPLSFDLSTEVLLDVISRIGKTIDELGEAGAFHRDISYGNIVYAWNPFKAYLSNLGSASTHYMDRSSGTCLFMSYGVLIGHKRTVSMELESLLYVLYTLLWKVEFIGRTASLLMIWLLHGKLNAYCWMNDLPS